MTLDRGRPEILTPPEHPQACCEQRTITVPPGVHAKTAQKHDYPSAAWRRSYARRTGAERGFATTKDRATNDIGRGWCRLMGLTPLMLFTATLLIVRNQRILAAWNTRQEQNARRVANGLPPKPAGAGAKPSRTSPRHHPDQPRPTPSAHDRHHRYQAQQQRQRRRQPTRNQHTPHAASRNTPNATRHPQRASCAGMSDSNVKIGLTEA
jgi:hypothetical protein